MLGQHNDLVEPDGQVLLTAYAESVPSTACPSTVDPCPHKAATIAERLKYRPVTATELAPITQRVARRTP